MPASRHALATRFIPAVATCAIAMSFGWMRAEDEPAASLERVTVERGNGAETFEGTVLVEAVDGGLLLERPDGRLELLAPGAVVARSPAERGGEGVAAGDVEGGDVAGGEGAGGEGAGGEGADAVGRRILAELPEGFDLLVTKHYCICHDTSRSYAQWCGGLFERLHDAFANYWSRAGFPIRPSKRPLVVVIFSSQERYAEHAAAALGGAAGRVAGYYDLMSNRVITYDLTGSDALRGERHAGGAARLAILSSPAASGLVATLVHEATHQMAFNVGMHRRLAPVPLWLSEGVATYFETPDLGSSQGWRAVGTVNEPRLLHWQKSWRPGDFTRLVDDDEAFRRADTGVDAYAGAWAMTSFLIQTRRKEFVRYLGLLAAKEPLSDDSPAARRNDFVAAFGIEPEAIEPDFLRFMARRVER